MQRSQTLQPQVGHSSTALTISSQLPHLNARYVALETACVEYSTVISASFQQLQDVAALQGYCRCDKCRQSDAAQNPRLPFFQDRDSPVLLLEFDVNFSENVQDGIRPLVHADQDIVVVAVQALLSF